MVQVSAAQHPAGRRARDPERGPPVPQKVPASVNPGGIFYAAIPDVNQPGVAVPHEVHRHTSQFGTAAGAGADAGAPARRGAARARAARRPPARAGWRAGGGGATATRATLQNQLFLNELRNYPEFANLYDAGQGPPAGRRGGGDMTAARRGRAAELQPPSQMSQKIRRGLRQRRASLDGAPLPGANCGGAASEQYSHQPGRGSGDFGRGAGRVWRRGCRDGLYGSLMQSSDNSTGRRPAGPASPNSDGISGLETVQL